MCERLRGELKKHLVKENATGKTGIISEIYLKKDMGHIKLLRSRFLSRGCQLRVQMDRAGVRADTHSWLTNAYILKGTFFRRLCALLRMRRGVKTDAHTTSKTNMDIEK